MFWSSSAGPSAFQLWNPFEKRQRILRTEPAKKPPTWNGIMQPIVCNRTNAQELTEFLCKEYRGSDWTLNLSVDWMQRRLTSDTLALLVKEADQIIGCIFSRPLGGSLRGSDLLLPDVRVIEGLCVRNDRRGQHLAGWLIAWMDYYTSQHKPIAHLWYRELPAVPYFSSAVQVETYVYVKTNLVLLDTVMMVKVAFETWSPVWNANISRIDCIYSNGILDPEDLLCFTTLENIPLSLFSMVIVVNTHRLTLDGKMIWEVLWCSSTNAYKRLNGVAFQLEALGHGGLLFATDAKERGGVTGGWPSPWVAGTAGVHCTHLYNYLPSERSFSIVALRGCI